MPPLAISPRQAGTSNLPINERLNSMHRMHNEPRIKGGPQTAGATLHWASQYDLFTGLMGMGVDRSNSRMVIELAKIKPGDKVLDVACGTGNLTLTAQSYAGPAGKVHGIDAAPEMIEVASKRLHASGRTWSSM